MMVCLNCDLEIVGILGEVWGGVDRGEGRVEKSGKSGPG